MYLETDESSWFLSNRTVQFWKRDTPTAAMLHVISRLKRWIEFTIMDAVFGLFFFACSSYQVFLQMCVKLKYARSHFIFSYNFHHFIAASGSVPELVYLSSTVVINKMNCREVFCFFFCSLVRLFIIQLRFLCFCIRYASGSNYWFRLS